MSGLSREEEEVMDLLVAAYNKFISLEYSNSTDLKEFAEAIHLQQGILALRIVRRVYPKYWRS